MRNSDSVRYGMGPGIPNHRAHQQIDRAVRGSGRALRPKRFARMRLPGKPAAAACAGLLAVVTADASEIDIRKCPLDTLKFADPWAGASFTVQRVGTRYEYLCDDGMVDEPVDEFCQGPFGELVLHGEFVESKWREAKQIFAVYYTLKAVPCCGWSIRNDDTDTLAGVKWLEAAEIPLLGEMPFASINPGDGGDEVGFGNEQYVMGCTLRE